MCSQSFLGGGEGLVGVEAVEIEFLADEGVPVGEGGEGTRRGEGGSVCQELGVSGQRERYRNTAGRQAERCMGEYTRHTICMCVRSY